MSKIDDGSLVGRRILVAEPVLILFQKNYWRYRFYGNIDPREINKTASGG
jgi:hypothetical protein